jgi:hypothetical protein
MAYELSMALPAISARGSTVVAFAPQLIASVKILLEVDTKIA